KVGAAARQRPVREGTGTVQGVSHFLPYPGERGVLSRLEEVGIRAGGQSGAQGAASPGPDGDAVALREDPVHAHPAIVGGREVEYAEPGFTEAAGGDQRAEHRYPGDEGSGAVDRIQDPD